MAAETSRRDLIRGIAAGSLTAALAASPTRAQGHVNRKLLLGGGGIKGAYQAGVLKALFEQGFVPNVIYGVSVGGLNAAFLVDRASFLGQARRDYYGALAIEAPTDVDPSKPVDWPFIGAELVRFWLNNIKDSSAVMRKKRSAIIATLLKRFNGFYDPDPLRSLVHRTVSLDRIRSARIPVSVFAINLDTWQGEYFDEDRSNFLDAIVAGASLPVVFPIVELDGQYGRAPYVDGGLRQNIPLAIALAGAGNTKPTHLVSVVCQSARQPKAPIERGYLIHLLQRYADIAAEEMLRSDIELIRQSGIPSVILRPSEAVAYDPVTKKPFELDNFESRHIVYLTEKGFRDGSSQIAALGRGFSAQGFK